MSAPTSRRVRPSAAAPTGTLHEQHHPRQYRRHSHLAQPFPESSSSMTGKPLALVTGGSTGIGYALAQHCLRPGFS